MAGYDDAATSLFIWTQRTRKGLHGGLWALARWSLLAQSDQRIFSGQSPEPRAQKKQTMSPAPMSLAQVIQLAVAPVFLLAGVGATLNVLAARIGRIIDRARLMEAELPKASPEVADDLHDRLKVLSKRATLINRAIALSVLCGLLVSLVVAALFVSSALQLELAFPIAVVFVAALLSLAAALVYFLREVLIATAALSFGGVRSQRRDA